MLDSLNITFYVTATFTFEGFGGFGGLLGFKGYGVRKIWRTLSIFV